jgi:hypothetical protein
VFNVCDVCYYLSEKLNTHHFDFLIAATCQTVALYIVFQALKAVTMKTAFWEVTPCNAVQVRLHFQHRRYVKERAGSNQSSSFIQVVSSSITTETQGAEPFLRSRKFCSYSRIYQHYTETKGSLPCSEEHSTSPYPEPDQSSPYHPILSTIYFNIIHPSTSWSS